MILVVDCVAFLVLFESVLFPLLFCLLVFSFSNRLIFACWSFCWFSSVSSILVCFVVVLIISHCNVVCFDVWTDLCFDSLLLWMFLFFCLLLIFMIKYPIWPFHAWLPEVHVEASTEVSVILASVILKVGFFGMYKFLVVNCFLCLLFVGVLDFFVLLGIFVISVVLLVVVDYKKLVAFWSIVHCGVTVLLFWYNDFIFVCVVIMSNFGHIMSSCFMFVMIGVVYDCYGIRCFSIIGFFVFSVWLSLFSLCVLFNVDFPFTFMFYVDILCCFSCCHVSVMYVFVFFCCGILVVVSTFYVFVCVGFFSCLWWNVFYRFDLSLDDLLCLCVVMFVVGDRKSVV